MRLRTRPSGPPGATVRPSNRGVGRQSSRRAEAVSDALRRLDAPHLSRRRRIAVLQTIAAWTLSVVGLYQFGVLRRVPEPSMRGLDADAVDASGEAYELFKTPDSAIGVASAGVTLTLAGMGGADRATDQPLIPLALFAKTVVDAIGGIYLTAEQVTRHRKICSWCTVSTVALLVSVPLAWPEARDAAQQLRRPRSRRG